MIFYQLYYSEASLPLFHPTFYKILLNEDNNNIEAEDLKYLNSFYNSVKQMSISGLKVCMTQLEINPAGVSNNDPNITEEVFFQKLIAGKTF